MASSTTHYGLVKQADSDYADNAGLNSNFDKIDAAIYNATARTLPGFTIPATAIWTQLTTANIASLDPDYQAKPDPSLKYPWFTDISFICSEDDEIYPEWDVDTAELGCLGPCIKVTTNKLRIYADSNKNGTALTAFKCKKG